MTQISQVINLLFVNKYLPLHYIDWFVLFVYIPIAYIPVAYVPKRSNLMPNKYAD
jgi:hypothetical protein